MKSFKINKILIVSFFSLFLFSCAKESNSSAYCEERNVGYKNEHTFCVVAGSFDSNTVDVLVSWNYKNEIEFLSQRLTRITAFWSLTTDCSPIAAQLQSVTWHVDISGEITYYVPKEFAEFNNPNPTPQMLDIVNGIDAEITPYVEKWFCQ